MLIRVYGFANSAYGWFQTPLIKFMILILAN